MGFLRLFLAIAVVATHAGKIFGIPMVSGRTAVECFFVISGFYMCMVLEQKYLRLPTRQWLTFIGSRVLRLFPVYLVVLLASALLVLLGGEIWGAQIGQLVQPAGHHLDPARALEPGTRHTGLVPVLRTQS